MCQGSGNAAGNLCRRSGNTSITRVPPFGRREDDRTPCWLGGFGVVASVTSDPALTRRPRRRRRVLALVAVLLLALGAIWGIRLWQLSQSVEEYAAWWAQPRGEPGGLTYVALGDSAAQGIGASAPDRGYVGRVADQLRAATGQPVLVINISRTGATIRQTIQEQLPRLVGMRADVITIDIGSNDIAGYDPARYEQDVTELIRGLPAGTVIADIPYSCTAGRRKMQSRQQR